MNAQVDVIILSWNRVDDTIAAISSAAEQEGVEKRILIVDQGSEPQNLSRLEAFLADIPCAQLKKLERNAGVAGGRNIATAMGSAPYIVALDSDAEFGDRHMLAHAVRYMDAHPETCAIGFRILNFFTGENDATSWDYPAGCMPDRGFPTTRFIGAGHAIRRSVFDAVGGYDERLFFCGEELDLCYRMLNTGARIAYAPEVTIRHKVSPEHRVFWGKGRFFYTVRNNIYTAYKFKTSLPRLLVAAGAFAVKGWRNGIAREALRASWAAVPMCWRFARSAEDKRHYDLSSDTWDYNRRCEPSRSEGVWRKIARQFALLPHQSSNGN